VSDYDERTLLLQCMESMASDYSQKMRLGAQYAMRLSPHDSAMNNATSQ
jgi:hypothetical protein